MPFKELDPRITAKLLEGHRDVITPLAAEREHFYQSQSCPTCGSTTLEKEGDSRFLFREGEALPRYLLRCQCGCVFDPHSGILLTIGNKAETLEPAVPLIDGED